VPVRVCACAMMPMSTSSSVVRAVVAAAAAAAQDSSSLLPPPHSSLADGGQIDRARSALPSSPPRRHSPYRPPRPLYAREVQHMAADAPDSVVMLRFHEEPCSDIEAMATMKKTL